MNHLICRVCRFRILAPYTLAVGFDDHTEQVIDFQPVLAGELYGPLREMSLFSQVKIDPEIHTLVWPNGADFDPATLHDWPEYAEAFAARARTWELHHARRNRESEGSSQGFRIPGAVWTRHCMRCLGDAATRGLNGGRVPRNLLWPYNPDIQSSA